MHLPVLDVTDPSPTMPDVAGGDYFGPSKFGEMRGTPHRVGRSPAAQDQIGGNLLWEVSEKLAGVTYDLPVPTT